MNIQVPVRIEQLDAAPPGGVEERVIEKEAFKEVSFVSCFCIRFFGQCVGGGTDCDALFFNGIVNGINRAEGSAAEQLGIGDGGLGIRDWGELNWNPGLEFSGAESSVFKIFV